jgi:DNA-binding transcriptional LysR family regulator
MGRLAGSAELTAFVRSVELGGFSAAARELALTPSALSKLVTRLENALGVRLLNRTTRKLATTAEGALFLARCRKILLEIEEAENEIGSARKRPRGRLRMHAGVGFGVHQLVPVLPSFLDRYPDIQLDLVFEDRSPDLVREGIDISVWPGEPIDTSLVARKLCDFERVICASPDYLSRHGTPRSPKDLENHNCIVIAGLPPTLARWSFDTGSGRKVVEAAGNVRANNADCALHLALMGLGIARMNDFIVSEHVRYRRLIPIRMGPKGEQLPLYALYPQARHRLPRVAAMLAFLTESFAHRPWGTARPRASRR